MTEHTFLEQLAATLVADYGTRLSDLTLVLPNRRAKVFLVEALRKWIPANVFAPEITSIEDFIQDISGIRSIDNIEQLFEFYEVYLQIDEPDKQPFEQFANWAKTLLQDFNEIDRYLLEPNKVLKYLEDIKEIEHWSLQPDKTELVQNYLAFWKSLPGYYEALYGHLLAKGIGYQGMVYREAIANLDHFLNSGHGFYVFAGFNALNAAEERIIQDTLAIDRAKIYWDIDSVFLHDEHHDAGLFTRRFKQQWKYYKSNPFEWISNQFSAEKNISIIGTPKSVGQAKIAGNLIEKISDVSQGAPLNRVAIVLGEENMLTPLLYSLPGQTGPLNITMGYSGKNNPAQTLLAKLFKLHMHAIGRNQTSYVMYYKDVLDVLTHPLVEPFVGAAELVRHISQYNYTFVTHSKLVHLHGGQNMFFFQLFDRWENNPAAVLNNLSQVLLTIKDNLGDNNQQEKITKAFLYAMFKIINKLITYFSRDTAANIETLHSIYKQVAELAEVSFEGEPLTGLQIMGVLESRVLDFDTVIITSMNEGKFPAGKSQNSFIPYDVKRELGLPTYKEKDAIYTYHFYHLLQRAKNVYLLYNTESDGLDGGEKSRFITQLEVERQPKHRLSHDIYNAVVPEKAYTPIAIPKSQSVMARLAQLAEKGFSPSALTAYIRNPLAFYFQRILRISETDEVEENIALNTLGTIIHHTLEELYRPYVGKFLSVEDIKLAITKIDAEVLRQFKVVYKEGEIKKGKNLLAFEVAKRHVLNFLRMELAGFEADSELSVKILALEERFERVLEHPDLPFPVLIGGEVDRIELRNGRVRIVDYKTGKVDKNDVRLTQWEGLTSEIKSDKIIQVLAYAFMYEPKAEGRDIEVGIVSFKNMKGGFLPFVFKGDGEEISVVNSSISENYVNQLVILLNEILNPDVAFEEKI